MDGTEIMGCRYGHLVILMPVSERNKSRQRQVLCQCDCGKKYVGPISYIVRGHTISCGCLRRSGSFLTHEKKHGMVDTPEYQSWKSMKQRCGNPQAQASKHYIHRGISFCPEWAEFATFYKDVGPRPSPKHSLERIDNNGNYEPNNVIWATHDRQMNNTRRNHKIEYKGRTLNVGQWAKELGMDPKSLDSRINRLKWSVEKAFTEPMKAKYKLSHIDIVTIRELYQSGICTQLELASKYEVSQTAISDIITRRRWKHVP